MKKALLLNAVDPAIGGVLIRGDRGTAKSSAVRALARLLPEYDAVEGCPYRCDPAMPSRYCDECRRRAMNAPTLPSPASGGGKGNASTASGGGKENASTASGGGKENA